MADWIDVAAERDLAEGGHVLVEVNGTAVAVFKIDGACYAVEDACSHDGGELASGELIGDEIVCPRHGARFCVRTGEVKCPPAYEDLLCFPLRVAAGRIQVADPRE